MLNRFIVNIFIVCLRELAYKGLRFGQFVCVDYSRLQFVLNIGKIHYCGYDNLKDTKTY